MAFLIIDYFTPQYIVQMETTLSKKTNSYRVSIRKQQIQAYKKSKRKLFINEQPCTTPQGIYNMEAGNQMYTNLLNYISIETLQMMDRQTFANNIQMLIEIVSSSDNYAFKGRFQPLLCTLIEFFQYVYNRTYYQYTELVKQNPIMAEKITQNIIKLAIFNKIFAFIEPNSFLKLIGLIYYEIAPQSLSILSKTVIFLRQILSYCLTDGSVITHYLSFLGSYTQPINKLINKSTVFLVLLNITYSQSPETMQIVYKQNILSYISSWVEEFGFSMYEKEVIAGIYGNCIEYLCWLADQNNHQSQNCDEGQMNYKQSFLFLPLFEDLVKTQNKEITEKLIFISVNLLSTAQAHNLPCLPYLVSLNQEIIHNVVCFKQYYQKSEDLFILLAELYRQDSSIVTFLEFLSLILNKYTIVYYQTKSTEKNRENGDQSSNTRIKGLQNISKLMVSCQNMLCRSQLDGQQLILQNIIDFWCKQQLFSIKQEIITFVTTALSLNQNLTQLVFNNHLEVVLQLMDQSYQRMSEIEAQLKLINVFLRSLDNYSVSFVNDFLRKNADILSQISVRLQDYLMRVTKENAYIFKLAELSMQKIEQLLKTSETI